MNSYFNRVSVFLLGAIILFGGIEVSLASAQGIYGTAGLNTSAQVQVGTGGSNQTGASDQTSVSANANTQIQASGSATVITRAKDRADQEIDRRVNALTAQMQRVDGMGRVSASDQATINANIQAQIQALASLKSKIEGDGDTTSLKADIQSIVGSYRIFMLVIPQGAITAATDRIATIVTDMQTIGGKVKARLDAAASAGINVSAAMNLYTDYMAKLSDASTQASAAKTEIAPLQPDNGNTSVMQSNQSILNDARLKLQAAQRDVLSARADLRNVLKILPKMSATASTSASTSVQNY